MYQTLLKVKDRVKTYLGDQIKTYFLDDPRFINLSSLPCIAIVPVRTEINIADTGRDVYKHTIDVYLIINPLTHLDKQTNELVGMKYLTETMEGRDSTTDNLNQNTILYSLRTDLNLDAGTNLFIDNIESIDYTVRIRNEQEVTLEAWLRLTVIKVLNR